MDRLEIYLETIKSFFENVTTESVVGELISTGLDKNSVLSKFEGQHKRAFSRDLENVSTENFKNQEEKLIFHLNRDGLYDALPQALFHESTKKTSAISADVMVEEYQIRKKEESEAREFFSPLEHEFFYKRVENELDERKALSAYSKFRFDDSIVAFFDIDTSFPANIKVKLMCLLPVAHRFKGNFEMVARIITLLTKSLVFVEFHKELCDEIRESRLGMNILGEDITTGDTEPYSDVRVHFNIGPVKKRELYNFLPEKMLDKMMSYVFSTFIPVEYSPSYSVNIEQVNSLFLLNEADKTSARLAYTTTL